MRIKKKRIVCCEQFFYKNYEMFENKLAFLKRANLDRQAIGLTPVVVA